MSNFDDADVNVTLYCCEAQKLDGISSSCAACILLFNQEEFVIPLNKGAIMLINSFTVYMATCAIFPSFYLLGFLRRLLHLGRILFTSSACTLCRIRGFDPVPARTFGLRVLELKEYGVGEDEAMAVADVCILQI